MTCDTMHHSARAEQERLAALAATDEPIRRIHLELSRLHAAQAQRLPDLSTA